MAPQNSTITNQHSVTIYKNKSIHGLTIRIMNETNNTTHNSVRCEEKHQTLDDFIAPQINVN